MAVHINTDPNDPPHTQTHLEGAVLRMDTALEVHRPVCLAVHGEGSDGVDADGTETEVEAGLVHHHQGRPVEVGSPEIGRCYY
jgi:hypothetical protein